MEFLVGGLLIALIFVIQRWRYPIKFKDLEASLGYQIAKQHQLQSEVFALSNQLAALRQEVADIRSATASIVTTPTQWGDFLGTWAGPAPAAEASGPPLPTEPAAPAAEPAAAPFAPVDEPTQPAAEVEEELTQPAPLLEVEEELTQPAPEAEAQEAATEAAQAPETNPEPVALPEAASTEEEAPVAEPALAEEQAAEVAEEQQPAEELFIAEEAEAAEEQPQAAAPDLAEEQPQAAVAPEAIDEQLPAMEQETEEAAQQPQAAEPAETAAPAPAEPLAPAETEETEPAQPSTEDAPPAAPEPATEDAPAAEPELAPEPTEETTPALAEPAEAPAPEPEPTPAPTPRHRLAPPRPPLPPARPALRPKPVPTGPTFWERTSTVLLENWTGILGAVVLVTGVGFLGIYAALRVSPQLRFLLICAFAGVLLGTRFALRKKDFATKLNAWLLSSAAAIFLFACVGAVSIAGLMWVTPPFDYLLLLAGVSANLYLAWRASRQEIATLHGVLSLVALAVLPPAPLTLAAAAGVTAFSIAITYRQQWKYQLLLSIVSFFAFHLYWHQQLPLITGGTRLVAMALVLLVGGAAAVVQYRRVYAERRFEPLLFASHLLNWTSLAVNMYFYSTGSLWKTLPLAVGTVLTFWAGRQAKRLGIGWLFQTDTIISLILGLATALSLQGWHATPPVILLFMLLETLLVALVMARQREALVYRVALGGALLAGTGLLLLAGGRAHDALPATLYRDALVLALAGWAGLAFLQVIFKQPLLTIGQALKKQFLVTEAAAQPATPKAAAVQSHRRLLSTFAGVAGALQAGAGLLLARALFAWPDAPVTPLLLALTTLAGGALGLGAWVQAAGRAPDWVRRQQLVLGQLLAMLAVVGLHEAHLSWPVILTLLFAENLGAVLLARRDTLLHRFAMGGALLTGLALLLACADDLVAPRPILYRDALLLGLAGWSSVAFAQLAFKRFLQPAIDFDSTTSRPALLAAGAYRRWLSAFAGLGGGLQLGAGLLVARVLFGAAPGPVALLIGALLALAGSAVALATWLRKGTLAPGWVRWQQLVLGQAFVVLAIFGLHEMSLTWSALLLLLFAENLLVILLLAGRDEADHLHRLLYRAALAEALLTGTSLLLSASRHLADSQPPALYREALLLALAGWAGLAFMQLAFKFPLLLGVKPTRRQPGELPATLVSNPEAHRSWLGAFAGLAGLLQAGTGALLAHALFGWHPAPVKLLLGALGLMAASALGLAAWVRTAGRVPDWVRRQQLVLGQLFIGVAIFGLHELGLNWPEVLLVLYLETLVAVLLLARRDGLLHRAAMLGALAVGASLLLLAATHLDNSPPPQLYRDALLLALAGWTSIAFVQATGKQLLPPGWSRAEATVTKLFSKQLGMLLNGFAGLAGLLQVGTGLLLARVLFGWAHAPVAGLLGALVGLAAAALALAYWVRSSALAPDWLRRQQLVLTQFFLVLAIVGLHEAYLGWPVILALLFAENLLAALLLARRDTLLHRAGMAEALLTGAGLLLLAAGQSANHLPPALYRDALLLALAGWGSFAFLQATFRQFFTKNPAVDSAHPYATTVRGWLNGFAGLAGFLQAGAGLLLAQVLFKWSDTRALGALPALALAALGLAYWVHRSGWAPRWVRRQQLVLAQLFVVLAIVGLHKVGLTWPGVLALLFTENLLAALPLAKRDTLLHRASMAEALLTGAGLLLFVVDKLGSSLPPALYRDALLLALAGWGSLAFLQVTFRQFFAKNLAAELVSPYAATVRGWLSGFAGLAGFLQAGAGLLLANVLFEWADTRVLALLPALALAALGLGYWVHRSGWAPRWVRRQQLVLAQVFMLVAVVGLHKAGLTWPGVLAALYAENLLAALLLARRDEEGLLHGQTYLLIVQAVLLPVLVRATAPGYLAPLAQAGLLLGAALLTLGYQLRRLALAPTGHDYGRLPALGGHLPILSMATGWLLLGAGSLEYTHPWAGWAMVGLLGALLYLCQRRAVPGLGAGLVLAAIGYVGLQWSHVLPPAVAAHLAGRPMLGARYVLLYLLPTLAVPLAGLRASWWPAGARFVRWPWLYLLGGQLVVMLLGSVPPAHLAYLMLGLLALAGTAFAAAQAWRRTLPDAAAVGRAGQPDRYLLHLSYGLLLASLLVHLRLLLGTETLLHRPAEYFTAAAYVGVLAVLALARPPATAPVYASWRRLHPFLPEVALLFGSLTLAHHVQAAWLGLVWVAFALIITAGLTKMPLRLRRLGVYGRLYFWLAAGSAGAYCLRYVGDAQLLGTERWVVAATVALLFGYAGLALRLGNAPLAGLSARWGVLARPSRRQLEAALLYPAFGALALFFIQSFDRSVLTVLLMLEVVAVFSASLLLRRQDMRYVALAGMAATIGRLLLVDLSRSGTVTRAVVFIFVGLLLLGLHALYARFKTRLVVAGGVEAEAEDLDEPGELEETLE
jgi:hypothetical protein